MNSIHMNKLEKFAKTINNEKITITIYHLGDSKPEKIIGVFDRFNKYYDEIYLKVKTKFFDAPIRFVSNDEGIYSIHAFGVDDDGVEIYKNKAVAKVYPFKQSFLNDPKKQMELLGQGKWLID